MKKIAISILILIGVFSVQAQNTPFFGHYMFNPTYFNPSWGVNESKAFVAAQHRSQWLGYSTTYDGSGGAPNTQMLTGVVPIRNFFLSSVGINIINDNLGPITNMQVGIPLTYTLSLKRGVIGIGVAPAVFSQTTTGDYRPNQPGDPSIPTAGQSQIGFNLNSGIFYSNNRGLFLGAAVQNIPEPGFDFGNSELENRVARSYALHGGYRWSVNEGLSISPAVLVRSDLSTITFDVGAIATIGERIWTGISYRRQESSILYLGYSLLEDKQLKVGYSFDYVFVNQEGKAATTHELFLRYDLPDLVFGGRKKVKTPRFSF
ncbi:MAG: hypothetical protein CMP48_00420 [Rickettsiales bacterium]|nr:hypothetical protein [Rickettsiales bacterium]